MAVPPLLNAKGRHGQTDLIDLPYTKTNAIKCMFVNASTYEAYRDDLDLSFGAESLGGVGGASGITEIQNNKQK